MVSEDVVEQQVETKEEVIVPPIELVTDEAGETSAEQAVEKVKKKKHKMEATAENGEPPKKKKKKIAIKNPEAVEGDEGEKAVEVPDINEENKDNVSLPGSSLGVGILSDKSFSSLAPLVSEATLQVPSLPLPFLILTLLPAGSGGHGLHLHD